LRKGAVCYTCIKMAPRKFMFRYRMHLVFGNTSQFYKEEYA